jgi:hypothetical protein
MVHQVEVAAGVQNETAAQIVEVRVQQVADLAGARIRDQQADVEIGGRPGQPLSSVRVCEIDGDHTVSDTVAG